MRAKLLILPAALALVQGCGDLLTETPQDFLGPENFYRTATDAEAAVNGVYAGFLESGALFKNGLSLALDAGSDDARVGPQVGQVDNRITGALNYSAGSPRITNPWGEFYKVITRANDVVDRVPSIAMPEARKASIIGEAKFLRALSYFYLVRLYGDVPLVIRAEEIGLDVSRAPKEQVYQQIIRDATEAAAALPTTWTGSGAGRATQGAALALLADVHLTRREWSQAATAAKRVIDSNVYSLFPNYLNAFLPATKNGQEHVFSLQATGANTIVSSQYVRTYYPREMGTGQGGGFAVAQVTQRFYDSYLPGDYRKEVGYRTSGPNPQGRIVTFYPHVYKFRPSNPIAMDLGDVNIPIYRYAEVLLMYAEALNEQNQPAQAVTYLNMIRARARLGTGNENRADPANYTGPAAQAAVREAIFQERRWELAHEGKRWFDLLRRGQDYFMSQLRLDPEATGLDPNDMLWPVPQDELDLNKNLTQNPGY